MSDVAAGLDLPKTKRPMQASGFVAAPGRPEEFDRILRAQFEVFGKVAKAAGLIGQ